MVHGKKKDAQKWLNDALTKKDQEFRHSRQSCLLVNT
jgi:hypothetical protein